MGTMQLIKFIQVFLILYLEMGILGVILKFIIDTLKYYNNIYIFNNKSGVIMETVVVKGNLKEG